MSLTTDFIAELIRAANEADRLTPFEVKRLLNRWLTRSARCADRLASLAATAPGML